MSSKRTLRPVMRYNPSVGESRSAAIKKVGIDIKLDLQIITVSPTKSSKPKVRESGSGKFSHHIELSKYYKDKRKMFIASKGIVRDDNMEEQEEETNDSNSSSSENEGEDSK
ncbi:hypothetical protein G6F43_001821 [Rhizopus delemar]|nr:hypothetical protein G6F43_001821 [Rhizopus delemar]